MHVQLVRRFAALLLEPGGKRRAAQLFERAAGLDIRRRSTVFIKIRLAGEQVHAHEINGGIAPVLPITQEHGGVEQLHRQCRADTGAQKLLQHTDRADAAVSRRLTAAHAVGQDHAQLPRVRLKIGTTVAGDSLPLLSHGRNADGDRQRLRLEQKQAVVPRGVFRHAQAHAQCCRELVEKVRQLQQRAQIAAVDRNA